MPIIIIQINYSDVNWSPFSEVLKISYIRITFSLELILDSQDNNLLLVDNSDKFSLFKPNKTLQKYPPYFAPCLGVSPNVNK